MPLTATPSTDTFVHRERGESKHSKLRLITPPQPLTHSAPSASTQRLDLTLVIPTFNGGDRLPDVIDHLRAQHNIHGIRWEILVVDNNSSDHTRAVVEALQAGWCQTGWGLPKVALRYCFEPRQGLAFARQQAIEQAQGNWVGFIDDDNWPDPHWLTEAHRFVQETVAEHPQVVAFGSCLKARYETLPTPDFQHVAPFLAIRDHGNEIFPFVPEQLQLPAGAGLVVHRQTWLEKVPAHLPGAEKLKQRGEDYAALLYLHRAGGKIAYNPAMKVQHWIPAQRLSGDYLLKLALNTGLITHSLRSVGTGPIQRLKLALRTGLGGIRRLWRGWRDRPPSIQESRQNASSLSSFILDSSPTRAIVTDFQLLFHLGSALSPLYAISPRLVSWLNHRRIAQWLNSEALDRSF